MPKKTQKNSFINKIRTLSSAAKLVLIILSIVLVVVTVNLVTFLHQKYTPTKEQTTAFLQEQANKINFNGTVVYQKIQDNGCHANETSWLGDLPMYHICTVSMQKYFKNSGNISDDLLDAHEKMIALGFTGGADDPSASETGATSYLLPSDGFTTYNFEIYNPKDNVLNMDIRVFTASDQTIQLQPDEYVYGIQTVRAYKLGPFESKN